MKHVSSILSQARNAEGCMQNNEILESPTFSSPELCWCFSIMLLAVLISEDWLALWSLRQSYLNQVQYDRD